MYKEKLIEICKIINKHVKKATKSVVLYDESDFEEIQNEWWEETCARMYGYIESLLTQDILVWEAQLSLWCLKQDMLHTSVPRDRFFNCNRCKYGKRHKVCCCEGSNLYEKALNKIYYFRSEHLVVYELPGFLEELKNYVK